MKKVLAPAILGVVEMLKTESRCKSDLQQLSVFLKEPAGS